VARLRAEVERLTLALPVEAAHAGGLDAWVDAIKAETPSVPSFADSGKRYIKSGNPKSRGRLVYEKVFDRIARELKIERPNDYRAD
jgi:hypothetical protein